MEVWLSEFCVVKHVLEAYLVYGPLSTSKQLKEGNTQQKDSWVWINFRTLHKILPGLIKKNDSIMDAEKICRCLWMLNLYKAWHYPLSKPSKTCIWLRTYNIRTNPPIIFTNSTKPHVVSIYSSGCMDKTSLQTAMLDKHNSWRLVLHPGPPVLLSILFTSDFLKYLLHYLNPCHMIRPLLPPHGASHLWCVDHSTLRPQVFGFTSLSTWFGRSGKPLGWKGKRSSFVRALGGLGSKQLNRLEASFEDLPVVSHWSMENKHH